MALIFRGIAIEYRNKRTSVAWRTRWDWAIAIGSFVPALLWGVAFGNIVQGVPIDADKEFTGTFFTLLNPFALLGGLTTLLLFITHGAVFLALKTEGVHPRAGQPDGVAGRAADRASPRWRSSPGPRCCAAARSRSRRR